MSLTTTSLGRGRRVAAGSLIAVVALMLTACQNGSDAASRAPSAPSPSTAGSEGGGAAQPSASKAGPSGEAQRPSSGAQQPSVGVRQPSTGHDAATSPTGNQAHPTPTSASGRCTADAMSLRLGAADAGAGNIRYPLVFTNNGKKTCTLSGYPGVSLISRDGSAVGKPATREGGAGKAVTLKPGQSVHALLHTLNEGVNDTACWSGAQIVYVYPPGSKESMTTHSGKLRVCGGRFTVTSVEAGSLG
ncbi:DUF4232 domain-containing protein [Streptomyces pinistramenti]|uniref:DUF4232 domain-containing protein n=1 Tax=Streptomyces pinistramenti TaxID=2884812 RepID=UPI001D090A5D|nr:DUF4232 domain-containing protein [Streptomyces pinistramenti]MCB5908966.1 DUF4232 domain-containing protein [Streptomyces pinistramenti]